MENREKKIGAPEIKAALDAGIIEMAELVLASKVSTSTIYSFCRGGPVRPKLQTRLVGGFESLMRTKTSA